MGNSISGCLGQELGAPGTDRKFSGVYPTQFVEAIMIPSEKNDNKFYFIKNEEEIDKTIDSLDDTSRMNESKVETLDQTLADLREKRNALMMFPSYNSTEDISAVRELDEEQEESPMKGDKILTFKAETPLKFNKALTMPNLPTSAKTNSETIQGIILMEVQKAHFMQNHFLQQYKLSKPFVVIKVYKMEGLKSSKVSRRNSRRSDVVRFNTAFALNPYRPSWDEFFEHQIIDEEKQASCYSVGFSLFYISSQDHSKVQIGEEQVFSISSLLDQNVQVKHIDFKDPEYKGVLARVRVRLQFIYDIEVVKERLITEIKAKMERLMKIRERHPVFHGLKRDKASFFSIAKGPSSRKNSEFSQRSSMHENEETGYYVA